jgi:hypothetical protein
MIAQKTVEDISETGGTIFLINMTNNPNAKMDPSVFEGKWSWIKAPADWKPQDGISTKKTTIHAMIVFSERFEENHIRGLCEAIRRVPDLASIPLLLAVRPNEMPLANRVKNLPNAHFILTPISEASLVDRLSRLSDEDR